MASLLTGTTIAANIALHAGNYNSYALPLTGGAITGNSTFSADNYLTFGPNSSWSRYLRIGGNGYTAPVTTTASVVTTDGNLHLDAAKAAKGIYLNWYGGTSGTIFGNGSGTQVGAVDGSGNASFIGALGITGAITQGGNQVLHAGNVATYALPIGGGTLTGGLSGTTGFFSGDLSIVGQHQIRNANPTITFRDTNNRTAYIHVNGDIFYVLTAVADSAYGSWGQVANSRWPLEINLSTNNAVFGADVNAISFTGAGTGLTGTAASLTAGAVTNGVYTNTNNTLTAINTINNSNNTVINTLSGNLGLTMYQATTGTDAYMTFHISGDFAAYFGLGGAENDLVYGGWSVGNVRHRILHSGNAPYAWNMNQYVRTTDSPTFNTVTANITGNAYNNLSNNYKDIYVYGDVNTYYVVLIQGESLYSFGRYSVTRGYNWTGPDTWHVASHKGGLTLDWEWSGDTLRLINLQI